MSDPYLAFYVAGGGCSGLQYGLALAEGEPEIDDDLFDLTYASLSQLKLNLVYFNIKVPFRGFRGKMLLPAVGCLRFLQSTASSTQ